jgi:hypothetical protein
MSVLRRNESALPHQRPLSHNYFRIPADSGNGGGGGFSELLVIPPVSKGGCYTVTRRNRPAFGESINMTVASDVLAPLRSAGSDDTMGAQLHHTPVYQFRVASRRPAAVYALATIDKALDHAKTLPAERGGDEMRRTLSNAKQPRVYFAIRDNAVVSATAVHCDRPAEQAGWVVEMVNELCSCRAVPDRDFCIALRRPLDEARPETDDVPITQDVLRAMYNDMEPAEGELREFLPLELRTVPIEGVHVPERRHGLIPTRNLWNGVMTSSTAPFDEFTTSVHPATEPQQPNFMQVLQTDGLSSEEESALRSSRVFAVDRAPETSHMVFINLHDERGLDSAVAAMTRGRIVVTKRPTFDCFVVDELRRYPDGDLILHSIADVERIDESVQELDGSVMPFISDFVEQKRLACRARRFTMHNLCGALVMDALVETITATPPPPQSAGSSSGNWSPRSIVDDPKIARQRAVEQRQGALAISAHHIVSPTSFSRIDHESGHVRSQVADPTGRHELSKEINTAAASLLGIINTTIANSLPSLTNSRVAHVSSRPGGRPAPSAYEAAAALTLGGLTTASLQSNQVLGLPVRVTSVAERYDAVSEAYASVCCINALSRECESFPYTLMTVVEEDETQNTGEKFHTVREALPEGYTTLAAFLQDVASRVRGAANTQSSSMEVDDADAQSALDEQYNVLAQLRLVLEWAYDRRGLVHGRLSPSSNVYVSSLGTEQVEDLKLRFSDGSIGVVERRKRRVFVDNFTRCSFRDVVTGETIQPLIPSKVGKMMAEAPQAAGDTRTPAGRSLDMMLKFCETRGLGVSPHSGLARTRYTITAGPQQGHENTTFADHLPAELHLSRTWGSTPQGALRRYLTRVATSRVEWSDTTSEEGIRLIQARIDELKSAELVARSLATERDDFLSIVHYMITFLQRRMHPQC